MGTKSVQWPLLALAGLVACASESTVPVDAASIPDLPPSVDEGPDVPDVASGPIVYGSVVTVTGKAIVFDPGTLEVKISIPVSHSSMHGTGLRDDARVLWAPEPNTNRVDRIVIAEDWSSSVVETSIPLQASPTFLEMSPDGKIVATGSAAPVLGVPGTEVLKQAAFIDTEAKVLRAELSLDSPAHAQFAPGGDVAYILQQKSPEIPVVDLKTFTVVDTLVNPGFKAGGAASGEGDVRPSDGLLCIANLTSSSITCMHPAAPADAWIEFFPNEGPHDMAFDSAGKHLWVQSAKGITSPGDEFGNTSIPTTVYVVDVDARTRVKEIHWDYAVWHVATGPNGRMFVSGSWGSLLAYDAASFELLATAKLGTGPQPLMTVDFGR